MTPFGWLTAVLTVVAAVICAYFLRNAHSVLQVVCVVFAVSAIVIGLAIEIDRLAYRIRSRRARRRHPLLTGGTR